MEYSSLNVPESAKSAELLIVEDNIDLLNSMGDYLRMEGHGNIFLAANIEDATRVFNARVNQIKLAIVDLNVPLDKGMQPELHGLALIDYMLEINPGLKIILATAYDFAPGVKELVQSGKVALLKKAIETDDLINTVSQVLND